MRRSSLGTSGRAYGVLPPIVAVVMIAAIAVVSVAGRGADGPSASAAATPAPEVPLEQQCMSGAAGAGNDALAEDCALLLEAKDTLRGTDPLNWSADLAITSWEGITVSGTPNRVTRIVLNGGRASASQYGRVINLTGTIPPELGNLAKLQRLALTRSDLTGSIPPELGNLSELTTLQLYGNELTGGIPPELGNLSNLATLALSTNPLGGIIPVELGKLSSLGSLRLENNQLTGSIPASLGDLSELYQLSLYGNTSLTGCIPASLRGITVSDLQHLDLDYCTTTTTYSLTTSATGNGRTSPLPGTYSYLSGTSVTVTATPDSGNRIASWGGDCAASGTASVCTLTMDAARTASITFERIPHTLTVTATGGGSVTPGGTTTQYEGDDVVLTASWNDATHSFTGWGGDCSGAATSCTLSIDGDKTVTATFAALPANRCATTTAVDCIRAVYRGAPDDYAQVVDIPAALLLTADADGRYRVERGEQVTVVTAAPLPAGWTRFWLDRTPLQSGTPSPTSSQQLIKPIGTTYTFTPTDDEAGATLITFDLTAARPHPVRPTHKPVLGDVVVTTVFSVVSCESGVAVTNPGANAELVKDCETLLALRDTLAGDSALNWTAGRSITTWTGVTVGGTPQRVTALSLANRGLTGELSGLLGDLTGLTELRLDGNSLTGMVPSKLSQLANLRHVCLAGNRFTGCVPPELGAAPNNDVVESGLPYCGDAVDISTGHEIIYPLAGGRTFYYQPREDEPRFTVDIPVGLAFRRFTVDLVDGPPGTPTTLMSFYVVGSKSKIVLDAETGEEWRRFIEASGDGLSKSAINDAFDRFVESIWEDQ